MQGSLMIKSTNPDGNLSGVKQYGIYRIVSWFNVTQASHVGKLRNLGQLRHPPRLPVVRKYPGGESDLPGGIHSVSRLNHLPAHC